MGLHLKKEIFLFLIVFLISLNFISAPFGYDTAIGSEVTINTFTGNITNLSEMQDVNVAGVSDNDVLTYNSATGKWEDQTGSGGDITAVTAGTGLTGGGESGDVTLNVDAATCGANELSKYNGSYFDCVTDQTGGGGNGLIADGTYLYNDSTYIYFNTTLSGTNLSVNSSDYWDNLNTFNSTQMENSGGFLNILTSWLEGVITSIIGNFFDQDLNTTNNVTFGNVTANYFFGNGSQLTGLTLSEADPFWTGNFSNVAFINKVNAFGAFNQSFDTNVLFVDATNDRVGIGTNAPDSLLHIKGNIPGTIGSHPAGQIIIQNPTDSVWSNAVITGYESDGAGNPDQQLWYLGSSSGSNSDITFLNRRNSKLQLGTDGATKMTILGDGNVGIGAASPGDKLTIYDTSSVNVRVQSDGPDTDAGVVLRTATAPYWTIYEDESDSQKFIIRDSVGGDRLTIDTSGNVGINTTTPQNLLNVLGDINFTGLIYGNGSQLTGLTLTESDPFWTSNQSSYFNTTDILGFSYYNSTDFSISDYSTTVTILGWNFYNDTNFPCSNNQVLLGDGTCYDIGYLQNSTNVTNNSIYAQLSDLTDQSFAETGTPQAINLSTEDEIFGLVHSTGENNSQIEIVTAGVYTILAQPQVATGASGGGKFHMWLEEDVGAGFVNISNSNVELVLAGNEENVIPLIIIREFQTGDKIRVMGSVSDIQIILDTQSPSGEPVIPSIIFSMVLTGPTDFTDTDTNETGRFDNLTATDCGGTDKVVGVQNNGTVLCGADITGGGVAKQGDGIYLYNDSTTIYFNTTLADTNLSVNSSDYWDGLNTFNTTQFENEGGLLHLLDSWLTTFFDALFGTKDTDDLSQGSSNFYDNQSWAQTLADSLYYGLSNPYGYYNSTDFSISDYYLKNNPFGFYNSTDFDYNDYRLLTNLTFNGNTIIDGDLNVTGDLSVEDINISGIVNYTTTGTIRTFSNGCNETANSTGLYWIC